MIERRSRKLIQPVIMSLLLTLLWVMTAHAIPYVAPHHDTPGHPDDGDLGTGDTHYFAETGDAHHFTWPDQILATAEIDVFYDFRNIGIFANVMTAAQQALTVSALNLWAGVSNLNFIQNMLAPASDIMTIGTGALEALGPCLPAPDDIFCSGPGGTLGLGGGFFDHTTPDHPISSGVAWMDSAENWDETIGNGDPVATFDWFTVAVQEIGHALGLGHTDNLPGPNMMDGFYGGEQVALSANDITHIQSIYGAPAAVPEPSTLLLLGSGLAGLAAWKARRARRSIS